jgi:hypothetical protein
VRFVVVSAPRSGTGYAAELFTALGLPCQHETVFGLTQTGWDPDYPGESSWMAAPHLRRLPPDVLVLHQHRDVGLAAESLVRREFYAPTDPYRRYGDHYTRIRATLPDLERARRFVAQWHTIISRQLVGRPHLDYNVENLTRTKIREVCAFLDHQPSKAQLDAAIAVPHNVNGREP